MPTYLYEVLREPTEQTLEEAGSSRLVPWWALLIWRLACGVTLLGYAIALWATRSFLAMHGLLATSYTASGVTFILLSACTSWLGIRKYREREHQPLDDNDDRATPVATWALFIHGVVLIYSVYSAALLFSLNKTVVKRPALVGPFPLWLLGLLPLVAHIVDVLLFRSLMVLPYILFLPAYAVVAYIWLWMLVPFPMDVRIAMLYLVFSLPLAFSLPLFVIFPTRVY